MVEVMTFEIKDDAIHIIIPVDLIAWVAENHPEYPMKVHSKKLLAGAVMHKLSNGIHLAETGETEFQELIQRCIDDTYEDGNGIISDKDGEE